MQVAGVDRYLDRMRSCAGALGRQLREPSARYRQLRLSERDVELFERGLAEGLLRIEGGNRLITSDPWQGTAWLVEGNPAWPCWEYLPHAAAYVELVLDHHYPLAAIGFETDNSEMNLDLAVVAEDGAVLLLGEAKTEASQVRALAADVLQFTSDPGKAPPKSTAGAPAGAQREAWKLAHQLWMLRPPFLWLVASGERLALAVDYQAGLMFTPTSGPPLAAKLWPSGFALNARPRVVEAAN